MGSPRKITKFAIGRYSNGLYIVFGCIFKGVLRGIICHSYWPLSWRLFSFVSENEFQYPNDQFPHFRRRSNIFYRIYLLCKKKSHRIQSVNDFIEEIADMPKCCWDYRHNLFAGEGRRVIVEKYNRKIVVNYYSKIGEGLEFFVIQAIARKYGKFIIKEVWFKQAMPTRRSIFAIDECYVRMHTFHNQGDNVILWFKMDDIFESLIELYIQRIRNRKGIQEEFDFLATKKIKK